MYSLKALIKRNILIQVRFYSNPSWQNMNAKGKKVVIPLPFHAGPDPTPGNADVENQPKMRGAQTRGSEHATNAGIRLALARSMPPHLWEVFIRVKDSPTICFGARGMYKASLVPQP